MTVCVFVIVGVYSAEITHTHIYIYMAIRHCSVLILDFLLFSSFMLFVFVLFCFDNDHAFLFRKEQAYILVLSKMTSVKQNCQACVNAVLELKVYVFSFLPLLTFLD